MRQVDRPDPPETARNRVNRAARPPESVYRHSGGRAVFRALDPDGLHSLAQRARNLRAVVYRAGPEALAIEAQGIADDLAALALNGTAPAPVALHWRAPAPEAPAGDEHRLKRLQALVAHHAQEGERLRRLLASAARPRPRQGHRGQDDRQHRLDL